MFQENTNPNTDEPSSIDPAIGMNGVPVASPIPAPVAALPQQLDPIQGPPVPPGTPVPTGPVSLPIEPSTATPTTAPAAALPHGIQAEGQAIDDATNADKDRVNAAKTAGDLEAQAKLDEAAALEKKAADQRSRQDDIDRKEQANQEARAKLTSVAEQADRDVGSFKFHDYMSSRSVGSKIGILAGSFLSGLAGNQTNATLDKLIAQDFEKQKAELTTKENLAHLRHEGVRDFDSYLRDQRAVIDMKETNARLAIADEMQAQALRSNNKVVIQRAAEETAKIRQQAAEKRAQLENAYGKSEETRAHTRLLEKKAAGVGAGGGSAGKQQALTEALTRSGGEITPEVAAVADKLHIKPVDLRGMSTNFKQERRVDLADRKTVDSEINSFASSQKLPELTKQYQSLNKANKLLNSGKEIDPLTQVLVLQEYDKASKGGTATAAAMQTALSHLAGGADKIDQFIEKVGTGGLSEAQLNTLRTSLQRSLDATKEEAGEVHDAFQQTYRDNPLYAKNGDIINAGADRLFGVFGYSRKPKAEGTTTKPAATSTDTKAPTMSKADAFKLKQFANNNPKDPRAQAALDSIKAAGY